MTHSDSMIDDARRDRPALLDVLGHAGCDIRQDGRAIRCAFHDDRTPSAGVYESQDGSAWLYKCHGEGCPASEGAWDVWRVRAHVAGRDRADVIAEAIRGAQVRHIPAATAARAPAPPAREAKDRRPPVTYQDAQAVAATEPGGRLDARYDYHDADGRLVLVVVRIAKSGGKTFRQLTPAADGRLVMGCSLRPMPLYRLPHLAGEAAVVVVEGEKCAEALTSLGIPATTSAMGAGAANGKGNGHAKHTDWRPLTGKRVCVWPDNDDKGAHHADEVVALLREAGAIEVRRVEPGRLAVPLPAKGDAVDFLAALGDVGDDVKRAAVREVLRAAPSVGASREHAAAFEEAISGRRAVIPLPWPMLNSLTLALRPGAVTVIAGSPGAAKSFLVLSAVVGLHRAGHRVAVLELEEDRDYWLQRYAAILDRRSGLTDPGWLKRNPEAARAAAHRHIADIDRLGAVLWVNQTATYADVIAWIEDRCKAGARVLVIDPISVADQGAMKQWDADKMLMLDAKRYAGEAGASVIFVSHPKTGGTNQAPALNTIAGGSAIVRLASTVLWVEPRDAETVAVRTLAHGTELRRVNRRVRILKARNARGQGATVGFWFDPDSLDWVEQGIAMPDGPSKSNGAAKRSSRSARLTSDPTPEEDSFQ